MIIAQISDTHIALDTPDADRRMRDFASTIADINALEPAPDAIVHTGDIVHTGRHDEYAEAVATLAKPPIYQAAFCPNNLDDGQLQRLSFRAPRRPAGPRPGGLDRTARMDGRGTEHG
jgi:3',5'-cyclic-AMP phosphodiesterase